MREKLYLTISKFSIRSLFYDYFMFFDTTPYSVERYRKSATVISHTGQRTNIGKLF